MTDRVLYTVAGGDLWMNGRKIGRVAEVTIKPPVYVPKATGCVMVEVHIDDAGAFLDIQSGSIPDILVGATQAQPRHPDQYRRRRG